MKKKILIYSLIILFTTTLCITSKSHLKEQEDKEINNILTSMTIKEKITQMIMPSLRFWGKGSNATGVTKLNEQLSNLLNNNSFAGIILFSNNIVDKNQTISLINSIQNANANKNAKTKLFIGIDQEGGSISRIKYNTQTIGNMGLGATGNPLYARESANIISSELKSLGFNLNFAPVLDINNNPNNSVIGTRSFSDNPDIVSQYGKEFINGMHDNDIMTSTKHFMGHGNTSIDSHTNLPIISKTLDELKEFELKPFIDTIDDTDMIMMAHIQYPLVDNMQYTSQKTGEKLVLPASLSKKIITDMLRHKLGFNGIIITDAMDMDAIKNHFTSFESAKLAIEAGTDIILMPFEISCNDDITYINNYIDGIVDMVNNGDIPIKRIDESITRILKLKKQYGLLTRDEYNNKKDTIEEKKDNQNKEWNIELQSITLLKNNNNILPILDEKRITFIYTDNKQKELIELAIKKLEKKENINLKRYNEIDIDLLNDADIIIGISNISSINQPCLELFNKIISSNKKFILLSTNLPYDVAKYDNADAIIVCYNTNAIIAGIYTIFGKNNPTGKLPINIPKLSSNSFFSDDSLYAIGSGIGY